ncbi:MAG: sulfotransferase domain-containing protein, partial [Bacteroidota bacterium]
PRSGNTWMRVLIERITQQRSGSIYGKEEVFTRAKDGIVIKTHSGQAFQYNRVILLVRNPYDAIVSYFHWKKDFSSREMPTWEEHVEKSVQQWKKFHLYWFKVSYPKCILRYEEIKENPQENLRKVTQFLGFDYSMEAIHDAVESATLEKLRADKEAGDSGRRFFRKGKSNDGINFFSAEQRNYLKQELEQVASSLGYQL